MSGELLAANCPLPNLNHVLRACRLAKPSEIRPTLTAFAFAFPGTNEQLFISSPNIEILPAVPMHRKDELFRFYRDGMLNYFEFLKWPQAYYPLEPHAAAAPGNPQLLAVASKTTKICIVPFLSTTMRGFFPNLLMRTLHGAALCREISSSPRSYRMRLLECYVLPFSGE
ncbi:hypothetical protein A0H81_03295 [Grifola frondosa]|uniref:Uncharacterized protein n=1 Tax=Grifola frondosa TaxID=5627 RepID=A0A1C7MLZ8_GRIFR|nr:hypothetical protein A0H81_03295 [Grifola frondosa]